MIRELLSGCIVDYDLDTTFALDIKKIDADEALDLVEAEIAKVKNKLVEFVRASVSGDTFYYKGFLDDSKKEEERLNKIWNYINDDDADTYYLEPYGYDLAGRILKLCDVTIRHAIDFTNHSGVQFNEVKSKDLAPLTLLMNTSGEIVAEDRQSADIARAAYYDPSSYRKFKCKDCGCNSFVKISQDDWMRKKGFEPIKRCTACRGIKKYKQQLGIK